MRLPNCVHLAVFAPTRVGKGVSIVIPWLLTENESAVVIDFKGALAWHTSVVRKSMGHQVVILDPFGVVAPKLGRKSDTFNPLDCIEVETPLGLDDCRSGAAAMVVRDNDDGTSRHFNDKSEDRIAVYMELTVAYGRRDKNTRSLHDVAEFISNPEKAKVAEELMKQSPHWDGMLARMGYDLGNPQGDELASIKSVSSRHLRFLNSPPVAANIKQSTFNPANLKRRKMTIYCVLPPDQAGPCAGLLRLWIDSFTKAVVREGLGERPRVTLLLDEAKTLGHMAMLEHAVDKYAGYGIGCLFIYQSMGHLKPCWPADQGQTLLSNTTQVFFGVNDLETATYVSKRCGNYTNVVDSGGQNEGSGSSTQAGGGGRSLSNQQGTNTGWQQQTRELLKPEEVLALPPRKAITFVAGMYPVRTWLLRWFEEKDMRKLVEKYPPKARRQRRAWLWVLVVIGILVILAIVAGR